MSATLIEMLDQLLPQTQCQRCGFDGCRPYAVAMATVGTSVARCPPGGEVTRQRVAAVLGRDDPAPVLVSEPVLLAEIVEADCIGCARCLEVCPADAIIGAAGRMHTVLAAWCTGCDRCAPVCPTACIVMQSLPRTEVASDPKRAALARTRYQQHQARVAQRGSTTGELVPLETDATTLRATVAAALARRERRRDES